LGVFLTALVLIDEGNPNEIDGKVNFEKAYMISRILENIRNFQLLRFNFTPVDVIAEYLSLRSLLHCAVR
jgi:hypothetical protein